MAFDIPVIEPVDAQLQRLLDVMHAPGYRRLSEMSVEQARCWLSETFQPDPEPPLVARIEDWQIPVRGASIACRVYDPEPGRPLPLVVYFHGGGWVLGDLDSADAEGRRLAVDCHCVVVSVDYRLAPEFPFPTPYEDCLAAIHWVAAHAERLGGRFGAPLALAGASAGGNLAAACALALRDVSGPALCGQLLIYPVTDADFERPSMVTHAEGKLLERGAMQWFWDHYCPDLDRRLDPRACPIKADSLAGLPPSLVSLASHDPLYDEGLAYACRLQAAGVPTRLHVAADLIHAFTGLVPLSRRCAEEVKALHLMMRDMIHA